MFTFFNNWRKTFRFTSLFLRYGTVTMQKTMLSSTISFFKPQIFILKLLLKKKDDKGNKANTSLSFNVNILNMETCFPNLSASEEFHKSWSYLDNLLQAKVYLDQFVHTKIKIQTSNSKLLKCTARDHCGYRLPQIANCSLCNQVACICLTGKPHNFMVYQTCRFLFVNCGSIFSCS